MHLVGRWSRGAVALSLLLLGACGGGGDAPPAAPTPPPVTPPPPPPPPTVSRVDVTPGALALVTREVATLAAQPREASGAALTRTVTWSTDNAAVATVSPAGVVTAVAPGTTTIGATADGVRGTATVSVRAVPVGTVSVSLSATQVVAGTGATATAVVTDSTGVVVSDRPLTWSSSAPAVAAVSPAGAVSTLAPGTAVITATAEGRSGAATLTVLPVPVASVSVQAAVVALTPGATTTATATARSAAGALLTGRAVTWSSSAQGVATVNAAGQVSAVAPGVATITATIEGRSAGTEVQVHAPLAPWVLRDSVVVLEFPSVYSVHPAPNPAQFPNLRAQPGSFDMPPILQALAQRVQPAGYDFVLLFTLREVPGWINSGVRYAMDAKNLGVANFLTYTRPAGWTRLRSAPHMNYLDFWDSTTVTDRQSPLVLAHEMGHHWGNYLSGTACNAMGALTNWQQGVHPTACLAGFLAHWTYLWTRAEGPGILYSGATNPRFNEFDLYAMGLMGYAEVRPVVHEVREDRIPAATAPRHRVTIDTLLTALALSGPAFCEGNCRRIPDTDPTAQQLRVLAVIVKGADEVITESRRRTALELVRGFPAVWSTATSGRSSLSMQVVRVP